MEPRKTNQNFVYDAFGLIQFIWNKKWILIALSLVAFIVSIIVSLNMTPRYRSEVILYPAASFSLAKNLVEPTAISTETRDVLSFGGDFESERLIQILHSNDIRDHVAKKFNLMEHYEIDPKSPFPENQLNSTFRGNVKIRRTEFMSIEIGVLDTKAQMASDIANEIVTYVDSVYYNMSKQRAMDAFNIVKKEYEDSQNDIRHYGDSLQQIRQKGVIDYESQASALNTAYANSLEHGNIQAADAIKKQLNILSVYGGRYIELSQKLEAEISRMSQLKAKYASSRINIENILPHVFVVDKARVEEKKVSPRRTVIVMFSTLSTFAIALILLLLKDNFKARN
jgi:tyrosine-protein kinase Etk/Wzc